MAPNCLSDLTPDIEHRGQRSQRVLLDQTNLIATDASPLGSRDAKEIHITQGHGGRPVSQRCVEQAHQCSCRHALPRTGLSDKGKALPRLQSQVDSVENCHRLATRPLHLDVEISQSEQCRDLGLGFRD
jgi:hypothetical protein